MTLTVPENWPLCWFSADGAQIKMSCPTCGNFSLLLTRRIPSGEVASLVCDQCSLSGAEPVQRAFNVWVAAHAQAQAQNQADHETALQEGNRGIAVERQRNTKKAA